MNQSIVVVDQQNPYYAILSLNRPEKRNALTIKLMESLTLAIQEVSRKKTCRAVIINGIGSVFCAGLDLIEAQDLALEERSSNSLAQLLKTVEECSLITIAVVHGAAIAGGAGLMCACDLTIAESGTMIALPETRRGLVAAQIMPYIMRLLPRPVLSELLFLGESITAERAFEIGLINRVVTSGDLLKEAIHDVELIRKGAPNATMRTKCFLRELDPIDITKGLNLHREIRHSDEAKEGIKAFIEQRPTKW